MTEESPRVITTSFQHTLVVIPQPAPAANVPSTEPATKFISRFSYNCPDGKHIALIDGHTIYYFDHTTVHSTTFRYSHRKFYPDYSEYYLTASDGKSYIVFTLIAARLLIPGLTIPDPSVVIVPVQASITLIYQHGTIETYPVSNRIPTAVWHGSEK